MSPMSLGLSGDALEGGVGFPVPYHNAGTKLLWLSTVVSLYSGAQYMRHFLAAALKQSRAST